MSGDRKLQIVQTALLTFVALSMSMALAHLMEMPARLEYPFDLWTDVTFRHGTYWLFGAPLGATIEGAAWIGSCAYAFNRWRCAGNWKSAFGAAVLMVTAHAIWWLFVFPVNMAFEQAAPLIPENGSILRLQWERGHAVRALLQFTAFAVLTISFTRKR